MYAGLRDATLQTGSKEAKEMLVKLTDWMIRLISKLSDDIFPPGFTCPAVLWIQLAALLFRIQDFHLLWLAFPCHSARYLQYHMLSEPREYFYSRFGLFRFRSPLLAESRLISFPRPT